MQQNNGSGVDTNLITLTRHTLHDQQIIAQQQSRQTTGDLTLLLVSIQLGCKFVASSVRRAGLAQLTGLAGGGNSVNVQGEEQKKLDVLANEIFINSLISSGKVSVLVSEENEQAIIVSPSQGGVAGKYCVVFDPLDGSSNIDAGVSIGTIFGIYSVQDPSQPGSIKDVLRPGREMVAAGYAMYGSSTTLVVSTGNGVNGYTLDPSLGEFILTHPNIRIPSRGKIYSINEGNSCYWTKACQNYFESLKKPVKETGRGPYSARYIGSMVADVHRTLLYGGIFAYPADSKSTKGKLRLLYECFPMAYLVEQAGGRATTGTQRILDIVPSDIHSRCPIALGSREDVEDYEKAHAAFP